MRFILYVFLRVLVVVNAFVEHCDKHTPINGGKHMFIYEVNAGALLNHCFIWP